MRSACLTGPGAPGMPGSSQMPGLRPEAFRKMTMDWALPVYAMSVCPYQLRNRNGRGATTAGALWPRRTDADSTVTLFVFPLCGFSLSLFCNYCRCSDGRLDLA